MGRYRLLPLVVLFLLPTAARPQASNSTIRGSVHDQSQTAIPGATVTLTNRDTNVARTTRTNEAGLYVFPAVIPGPYLFAAESPGMQKFEATLTVQVQRDTAVDAVLQVGQTATQVEVKDVTPIVQENNASLGQTLERQRVEQLPLQGRGYQNLLQAVPGVMWRDQGNRLGGRVQVYGLPVGSSVLVFDGAPMSEVYGGWDFGGQPGLDSVQEIRVEVNNSSAKFSRPASIVMSSRSGTNQFHGSIFETNRNSAYGVARRREDYYDKTPYVNRNEYGVSGGAPLYIPKIYNGKNRTFWFVAWEGTRFLSNKTEFLTVPTAAMRQGDFRGLVDASGRQYNLYDPYTTNSQTRVRQQLTYNGVPNTIDPARISPVGKFIFGVTKLPTHPQVNPLIDYNWIGLSDKPIEQDKHSIRIDHRISDKDLVYGRFAYNTNYESVTSPTFDGHSMFQNINGVSVIENNLRWWPNHNGSATWVRVISPSTTNELMVTGSRDWHERGAGDLKTNYANLLGLPNPFGGRNWTNITGLSLGNYSLNGDSPFWEVSNFVTVQDNATRVTGQHELQFGFHFRFEDLPKSNVSTSGPFNVNTLATSLYDPASTASNPVALPFTGHPLANLFLGSMDYNAQFRRPWGFLRRSEYAPYFQDNWKVSSRLTLNLGLRYEVRTKLRDRSGLMTSFDLDKRAYVIGTDLDTYLKLGATLPPVLTALRNYGGNIITTKEAGVPDNLGNIGWKNFGPRLGLAYRALSGAKAFVVRAGYRISYYSEPVGNWFGSQSNPQLVSAGFQSSVTNTALSPDGLPNYGLRSVPAYIAGLNTPSSIIDITSSKLITRGSFSAINVDPNLVEPRVHDWNFAIEKEVLPNTVARIAYTGNHTVNIQQTVNFNSATPTYIWYATQKRALPIGEFSNVAIRPYDQQVYGNVDGYRSSAYAWYNGAQFELQRRFSNGVGYQIFYVITNSLTATGAVPGVNNYLPGAVPADVKARNRFLNYQREGYAPRQQLRWNFIADLPFGRGKRFGGNSRGVVEKLIGGWQIAGVGYLRTTLWTLPTSVYPIAGRQIESYGYQYPIQDCRSGTCYPGYLWWNAYIPPNRINSYDVNGKPNGVMGVPSDYKPAGQPLIPWGSTTLPANAPGNTNLQSFWDTNTVWIPLNDGTVQRTTYNDNLHPWRNQYFAGPRNWYQDASLFKVASLTERVTLRFNIDFFNVFNNPNNFNNPQPNNPAPTTMDDGVLSTRNSGSPARVVQLALRLTW